MGTKTDHVMTLSNSIIGVGILAMPFCFQKCGIILSIFLLIIANLLTRVSCFYLVKSSMLCRRKSFEIMAFHAFGSTGKLLVELSIIGFLMGTCVTYMVVLGDLGPQIVSKILNIDNTTVLRTWVMILVTIFCVIPMSMLRNVDSLSVVCTASIGFYCCLVLKVMAESQNHISLMDWTNNVDYWKISGVLQCLPIISMALFCQLQIFEVFETTQNVSPERMNGIVKTAVTICTGVYILVGCFGYIAFCTQSFSGNILLSFSPSFTNDAIKIGFVLSIAFSFPLVIFPCRVSVNSLLYRRGHSDVGHYIPEHRFRLITISLVLFGMLVGIMIPSIELVIGLVGSTIGIGICVIFPASCFIKISKKDSTEKSVAQMLLVFGVILMVLGTYANLAALEHKTMENVAIDKLPKEQKPITIKNHTHQNDKSKSIEIPIEIIPLPLEIKKKSSTNDTLISSYQVISNAQKSFDNAATKHIVIVQTLPPPIDEKVLSQPAPPVPNDNFNEKSIAPAAAAVDINREALQHEDHEIAIENNAKQQQQVDDNAVKIDETKELLNAQVDEIKKEFEKRNQETQKLVLEKFEQIAEKVEKIEQKQEKPQQFIIGDDQKSSHKLTMEKFEKMAEKMEKIVEHQEKEKFDDHQNAVDTIIKPIVNDIVNNVAKPTTLPIKPSKDTEKLVLQKFEEIAERVERIEQHQELQKKEIVTVTPTQTNILKKFEKIAEKVMKIEQNQMKDDKIDAAPTTRIVQSPLPDVAIKLPAVSVEKQLPQIPIIPPKADDNVIPQIHQLQPPRNIVAPQLILEKFKKIDDYIDKIEQKQKEMEIVQTPSPKITVDDADKEDAQQLVLEKFEKIAERVEKIEQKQAEQKKAKAATFDTVDEKLEKIVERVEKMEKHHQIEKIEENVAAAALPKLENTENNVMEKITATNTTNLINVKKSENIDPKIVLKKLDEIAGKLENTENNKQSAAVAAEKIIIQKNVSQLDENTEKTIEIQQIGLDPKIVLEKLNQIAKAVEKIDQKNKINENPVVKMIIDNQKQNVVLPYNDVVIEKRADSKAVPVPIMLLNTSIAANNNAEKPLEVTENSIQAIRRDLLAIHTSDANQTLRKKRSIDNTVNNDSDCESVNKCFNNNNNKQKQQVLTNNNLLSNQIDNHLPDAFSLGAAGIEMKMIGRGLKAFNDKTMNEKDDTS